MNWLEHITFEGGPGWTNDCSGRADFALIKPVDKTTVYSNRNESAQEYFRTTEGWVSPVYGTIHTVFKHSSLTSG
jgi:hypothetical protein